MSVKILSRQHRSGIYKATRCRAHNGKIAEESQYSIVRVQIGHEPAFNVPVCRVCDQMEDKDLINAMILESHRHKAENANPGRFTELMAEQAGPSS